MKHNIRTATKTVHEKLQALLSLYVETERFQGTWQGGDAWDYALCELNRIRGQICHLYRGPVEEALQPAGTSCGGPDCHPHRDPDAETPLWQVLLCVSNLYRILDETEYFIRQCEVPGVVTRWKQINPRLLYFDCAFALMEECPDMYRRIQRGLTGFQLSCYPDPELIRERNDYFANAKEVSARCHRDFSEEQLFQDELLRTLSLLFEEAARLPG